MYNEVGFALNGDVYCKDCAEELCETEEEWKNLQTDKHRDGGPMFDHSETESQYHCGMQKNCVNTTTEHGYTHDLPVGKPIETTVLDYLEEWNGRDPQIHHEGEEEVVFTVGGYSSNYKLTWERDSDRIMLVERTNCGTLETTKHTDIPEGIEEYARELIEEGKSAGAY